MKTITDRIESMQYGGCADAITALLRSGRRVDVHLEQ